MLAVMSEQKVPTAVSDVRYRPVDLGMLDRSNPFLSPVSVGFCLLRRLELFPSLHCANWQFTMVLPASTQTRNVHFCGLTSSKIAATMLSPEAIAQFANLARS
jgi:hypothetical protein